VIDKLCREDEIILAEHWGLALRLGQRLSGGLSRPLETTRLWSDELHVFLSISAGDHALYGETVDRRLKTLAQAMGKSAALIME